MSDDTGIYEHQGFRQPLGFGTRPALIVVDFVNGFTDPDKLGGGNIGPAIERTVELLAAARRFKLPIAFTRVVFAEDGSDHGVFNRKVPTLNTLHEGNRDIEIVDELTPEPGEKIVDKKYPSAFFATDLASWMAFKGADTAIVTGCTTSGCVRASVIDAMCHGFAPIVPADCVGDRAIGPHEANLFDMEQKYADVTSLDHVLGELERIGLRNEA